MDEHVPLHHESIRERKLVRSIEPVSPVGVVYPAPAERNVQPASSVPPPPPRPITPSSLSTKPAMEQEEDSHRASKQAPEKHDSPLFHSPSVTPGVSSAAALSLILPHNLSRSFDQTAAQSPPNYQAPLFRKASYGSSHYANFASADPQHQAGSVPQRVSPITVHQHTQQAPATSLLNSKPMDQRSNNPFILNFNNISGCCLKTSPTSTGSPLVTSPTQQSVIVSTTTAGTASTSTSSTSGAKRTRSLLLKSTSPLQQTLNSPLQASPPQCPPVPPRLSQIHAIASSSSSSSSPCSVAPSERNGAKNPPCTDIATLSNTATSEPSTAAPTATIVAGACYVTPPTPAPIHTTEAKQTLQAMLFESVPPAGTADATGCGLSASADGAASAIRKKRDDFLRTTMKICLVVSPPSKMQMKSLSLTHLDEIERQATTPTIISNDPHIRKVGYLLALITSTFNGTRHTARGAVARAEGDEESL
ncbi:hypothetical protein ZHAS_00009323 [Anopheles sinensis]|uniref:Uncharacterized protein n=1 Tax=Anopheles sinensis TaxID=74873 RepID=A0A084VUQ0_ANOSI|nr:hypothetical protein ZHAS_00009323 [Anopheles sinensis]